MMTTTDITHCGDWDITLTAQGMVMAIGTKAIGV